MNFVDLGKEIIRRGAPILGGVLAGPAGISVGSLIGNLFGDTTNEPDKILERIQADPEANLKLIQFQAANETELQQLALQGIVEDNKDRDSARNREIEIAKTNKIDNTPRNLAYILVLAFVISIFVMPYMPIDGQEKEIMMLLIGMLASKVNSIYDYFFGSSSGSKLKDDIFDRLSQQK
jgi:hypothetical protein